MLRLILLLLALALMAPQAAHCEASYPAAESAAQLQESEVARLVQLGFLTKPGSDAAHRQAVREFQRYLNRLPDDAAKGGPSASALKATDDSRDDAARALSIKPLTTYDSVESIAAFQTYMVMDNEGELGEDVPAVDPEPEDAQEGAPHPVTGELDGAQRARLMDASLPVYRQTLQKGDDGSEVRRVQRRLSSLKFSDHAEDGIFDGDVAAAVALFQRANDLPESGIADRATQEALFSEGAVANDQPLYDYLLIVDTERQVVSAYGWEDGDYTRLEREMVCSTGLDDTPTPAGTYKSTGPVARWCYFPTYGCWAQYAFRIKGGVLFHSVLYEQAKESTLIAGSVKKLGRKSSHGCVRLSVEDARWIFENCTPGTTVIVK